MKSAKQLIQELIDARLTQVQIGAGTGIPQATISRILSGDIADTKSTYWQAIHKFHADHLPESEAA